MTLDAIGLEVMAHAFAGIAEEMGALLVASSFSPTESDSLTYAGSKSSNGVSISSSVRRKTSTIGWLVINWPDCVSPNDIKDTLTIHKKGSTATNAPAVSTM